MKIVKSALFFICMGFLSSVSAGIIHENLSQDNKIIEVDLGHSDVVKVKYDIKRRHITRGSEWFTHAIWCSGVGILNYSLNGKSEDVMLPALLSNDQADKQRVGVNMDERGVFTITHPSISSRDRVFVRCQLYNKFGF